MGRTGKYKIVFILLVFSLIVFSYHLLFRGFFQHDEWIAFGDIFSNKNGLLTVLASFFAPNKDHYVPIFQMIFYSYIELFKFNFGIYASLSILLHIIVTFLVYLLSLKIFKNWKLAVVSAAFFGLSSSLYQATSWVLYDINSHYSTVFALISLIFFWDFIQKEKLKKLLFSILFLIISLFIKESAVGFFTLYPILIVLSKGWNFKKQFKYFYTILIPGFIYLAVRVSMYFIPGAYEFYSDVFKTQSLSNIILNLITIPSKVILQTIIPQRISINISRWFTFYLPHGITGLPGTTQFDVFVEQKTLQVLSMIFLIFIVFAIYRLWRVNKNKTMVKVAVFSLIFIIINSFIYAFSPGRTDIFSLIDSRNLYLPTVGTGVLLVSLAALVLRNSTVKIVIFILPLILWHMFYLNYELSLISIQGSIRKNILYQIKHDYPSLPQKVIFYTESDTSYYGMPENEKILPFEVGFGKTLLSWYQLQENYPRSFLKDHFLWDLTSQGYREEDGNGFGYFRNLDLIVKIIKEKNLGADNIIAYRFNSHDNSFIDITVEIRNKIRY